MYIRVGKEYRGLGWEINLGSLIEAKSVGYSAKEYVGKRGGGILYPTDLHRL